ncbi:5831_t:CDS:2 [Cetraspora pellucida]|uniref:5831_t:CDS:1 n=1 Tax=Cetraspora pellucida TaxID=1433469 RepID=A0A9N8VCP8_9GLOM|nr:5831_t:CDS:2 [Cetraspora pellucida]
MAPIHTLYSEFTDAKNFQECEYKLDSREYELESRYNKLLLKTEFFANKCSKFRNAKAFAEEIKSLEEELSLIQKYLLKKDSKIMFLKAKLVNIKIELDSKISKFEHLKSEDILVSVVGGDSEKNISKSRPKEEEAKPCSVSSLLCNNNISAVSKTSKNLSQYFACRKIINKVKKISTNILTYTNDKIVPILESSKINTEVTSKNMTLIRSYNITIGRSEELSIIALGASTVNKYQIIPIKQIFRPTPPSHSLNSKLDYTHSMTASDIDEATKHASLHCIGHLAMLWPFAKLVTEKSDTELSHILMFNSASSSQDVFKIVGWYTNDVKSVLMVINSYLRKSEFIVFDLNRAKDNLLAIQLRFDMPLDLQKEIKLRQKHKTKNALSMEPTNSEPEKSK